MKTHSLKHTSNLPKGFSGIQENLGNYMETVRDEVHS